MVTGRRAFNDARPGTSVKFWSRGELLARNVAGRRPANRGASLSKRKQTNGLACIRGARARSKGDAILGPGGFAVQGLSSCLGNTEDPPHHQVLRREYLQYAPSRIAFLAQVAATAAWQQRRHWPGQESITLIAYDEAGIKEASGGLCTKPSQDRPMTRWTLPQSVASLRQEGSGE